MVYSGLQIGISPANPHVVPKHCAILHSGETTVLMLTPGSKLTWYFPSLKRLLMKVLAALVLARRHQVGCREGRERSV